MSPLRQRTTEDMAMTMTDEMTLRKLGSATQVSYIRAVVAVDLLTLVASALCLCAR